MRQYTHNAAHGGVQHLLDKQREAARLFALGYTNKEVAAAVGYHPAYMPMLKHKNAGFASHLNTLRNERDLGIINRVQDAASKGLDILLRAVTPGTPECNEADLKLKVRIAQDLLDREGTAPRVSKTQSTSQNVHAILSTEDIAHIRERAEAMRISNRKEVLDI